MKYLIKGELELKLGDEGLFPGLCDFHIGAIFTDESMSLITGHSGLLPCLEANGPQQFLSAITKPDWPPLVRHRLRGRNADRTEHGHANENTDRT